MTFKQNLSKINNLVFLFGVSPYRLNRKSNKFECSALTLLYTVIYFACISITIIYISFAYFLTDEQIFQSTLMILTLLQQATLMFIFYSIMLNLLTNSTKHAKFLNDMVQMDSNLSKFNTDNINDSQLLVAYRQILFLVFFYAVFFATNTILNRNYMPLFQYVWTVMQYFQTMSITLVAYYIRCFALILNNKCLLIFRKLDSIGNDLPHTTGCDRQRIISELIHCFDAFDEVMDLKSQMSKIFGIQLLLNSAFDFIILTISVYGLLYFQAKSLLLLYYFIGFNMPHVVKSLLLVLALDTLANQINTLKTSALKISAYPNDKLSDLMDLIFLKISHMEKDKYVTANDFYPINRSMLYGMGAAIVTHMLIIVQFQQWEDSQPSLKQQNASQAG